MNIERRITAMHPAAQWALHRLVGVVIPAVGLGALVSLSGCGARTEKVEIPSVFEETGRTSVEGIGAVVTARDIGTGCEIIITSYGVMARNERSADGLSVKQRCVLTGAEQSSAPPAVTTTMLPADPGQASAVDSQAAAVADAVRQATAPAPSGRTIPPPAGKGTRPRAVPAPSTPTRATPTRDAPTTDGVESQLKN